jgi:hypothetical protein
MARLYCVDRILCGLTMDDFNNERKYPNFTYLKCKLWFRGWEVSGIKNICHDCWFKFYNSGWFRVHGDLEHEFKFEMADKVLQDWINGEI